MSVGIEHWLVLSSLLFALGVYGVLSRRSLILVLMSLELILNAAGLNFIVFSYYLGGIRGQIFTLFIIGIAAAEAAIGLAIVVRLYRENGSLDVTKASEMKW